MMLAVKVFLDACVLVPAGLCDTLMRAAEKGIIRIIWSEDILEEVRTSLVKNEMTSDQGAQKRIMAMRHEFPDASVSDYRHLIPNMTNDEGDRHVMAAAVAAGAQIIVTSNLRDFPDEALAPYDLEAQSPDEFLGFLYSLAPGTMIEILKEQAAALHNPPMTPTEVAEMLANHAPTFSQSVVPKLK